MDRVIRLKNTELEQKVQNAFKLKKIIASGVYSKKAIENIKKEMGIEEPDEVSTSSQDSTFSLLASQIGAEPDADKREKLTHELMILNVYKEMKDKPQSEIIIAVNNLKASFTQLSPSQTKSEDFQTKMMGKMMDKFLDEPKSELDNLEKLTKLIEGVQNITGKSDGLEEISKNIEAYKKIGFIKDGATTLEEAKLEVEKTKINKEFELEEKKIVAEAERTKSLTNMGGDVISSLVSAVGSSTSKEGKQAVRSDYGIRDETLKNAMNATCVTDGCGAKILVTNVDQSREVKCGKCNQSYVFDANEKKLFLAEAEQPGPGESPGPASDSKISQDTSQSSTA